MPLLGSVLVNLVADAVPPPGTMAPIFVASAPPERLPVRASLRWSKPLASG